MLHSRRALCNTIASNHMRLRAVFDVQSPTYSQPKRCCTCRDLLDLHVYCCIKLPTAHGPSQPFLPVLLIVRLGEYGVVYDPIRCSLPLMLPTPYPWTSLSSSLYLVFYFTYCEILWAMAFLSPQEIQFQLAHQHENRVIDTIIANTVMLIAAYVAVALRFTARRLMHARLGADDWVMMLGLVSREFK